MEADGSLHIMAHTEVHVQDVVADEPHQVGEVGRSCAVTDVAKHGLVVHCKRNTMNTFCSAIGMTPSINHKNNIESRI